MLWELFTPARAGCPRRHLLDALGPHCLLLPVPMLSPLPPSTLSRPPQIGFLSLLSSLHFLEFYINGIISSVQFSRSVVSDSL